MELMQFITASIISLNFGLTIFPMLFFLESLNHNLDEFNSSVRLSSSHENHITFVNSTTAFFHVICLLHELIFFSYIHYMTYPEAMNMYD